jgi:hypothetical protein
MTHRVKIIPQLEQSPLARPTLAAHSRDLVGERDGSDLCRPRR